MPDDLCEDLIAEIFGRLPTKSLLRLRCLSKSWYSRISSPTFIRNHALLRSMKTSPKYLVSLEKVYTDKRRFITYRLHQEAPYTSKELDMFSSRKCHVIGSCNGIVCLYGVVGRSPLISLWNPSIRRRLTVPVENPLGRSYVVAGFGFDPITNDYKIVTIYCKEDATTSFLYSMKTNSWISPPFLAEPYPCFVNGVLHWVIKPGLDSIHRHCCLLTFDLSSHEFGTIPLPKPSWTNHHPTTIKGSLAVISSDGYDSWMWVRREHNIINVADWSLCFNLKRIKDFKDYNPDSGMCSKIVSCADDDSYRVYLDMRVESLELLDKETC